jgi:AcrR family transcriptional regulator
MSAPRAKPLKRPSQARARFTVQAIYDAFVRIWQAQGWERLTTRAVALETGISVGTLYEYFPNKQALLSGYVRQGMDALLAAIDKQVVQADDAPWQERLHHLLRLTHGVGAPELQYYDPRCSPSSIRSPSKHHRRVHDELLAAWSRGAERLRRLAHPPSARTVHTLFLRPSAEGAICCW